eukprot:5058149-Amphidinium_carterae.1
MPINGIILDYGRAALLDLFTGLVFIGCITSIREKCPVPTCRPKSSSASQVSKSSSTTWKDHLQSVMQRERDARSADLMSFRFSFGATDDIAALAASSHNRGHVLSVYWVHNKECGGEDALFQGHVQ